MRILGLGPAPVFLPQPALSKLATTPGLFPAGSGEGILKSVCRDVHAQAMTKYYDREALAEEWHALLCMLDPAHPE